MDKFRSFLTQLWQFSRPHTIIGTSLSVIALYCLTLATIEPNLNSSLNLNFIFSSLGILLGAWIACLGGNVYIVGLNQLYDVEIDRVNKPHLPLASGEFSLQQGQWIVVLSGVLAMVLAAILSPWLLATVGISLVIGSAYSVPPLRLKRFSLLAAICILSVRGLVVNVGLFGYFTQALTNQAIFPPSLIVLTLFILIFSIAIALFKDVPDTEGDQKFQIQTFTLILGKGTVLQITRGVITLAYLIMMIAGLTFLPTANTYFLVGYHSFLLVLLWWQSQNLNLEDKTAIAAFYQFIWKLFFLEYLLFPLAFFIPA
ncbi:MAG: homogentisate phytyltransferase [Snowella sp.]|nr:homogentisate phytyltransferase [Snowella sp.]